MCLYVVWYKYYKIYMPIFVIYNKDSFSIRSVTTNINDWYLFLK